MNRVKELRLSLDLTQAEFAKKIGVSQQTLSGVESGARPLTDHSIITISSVFGVDEHWLRTGEGDMYPLPDAQEDTDLIMLMGELTTDDMDPRKKRLISTLCRLTLSMSPQELDTLKNLFDSLSAALDVEKNTED